jgi:hypothetical protein
MSPKDETTKTPPAREARETQQREQRDEAPPRSLREGGARKSPDASQAPPGKPARPPRARRGPGEHELEVALSRAPGIVHRMGADLEKAGKAPQGFARTDVAARSIEYDSMEGAMDFRFVRKVDKVQSMKREDFLDAFAKDGGLTDDVGRELDERVDQAELELAVAAAAGLARALAGEKDATARLHVEKKGDRVIAAATLLDDKGVELATKVAAVAHAGSPPPGVDKEPYYPQMPPMENAPTHQRPLGKKEVEALSPSRVYTKASPAKAQGK